jgi:hypothetical protein
LRAHAAMDRRGPICDSFLTLANPAWTCAGK